jgi:hypothetical protein
MYAWDSGVEQPVRSAYQPPASSTFLPEQTRHQQPASSTLLSKQTSTSHQSPANRTGWKNHHHPRHVNQWVKVLKFNTQMRVLNFSPHQKVGEKKLVRTEEKLIDTNDL